MTISDRSVLCAYRYDPLDRLAAGSRAGQGDTRFFYQKNRLAAQIQGQIQHTLLRTDEYLLAQRRTENNLSDCALLATDQQLSVIAAQGVAFAYTPYGQRHPSAGPMNLPGFAGQRVDPVTGHYLLGNGYRAFNPVLMRFNSPDSLSPFGEGGLNAYAYCGGDPVNRVDSSGHMFSRLRRPRSQALSSAPAPATARSRQGTMKTRLDEPPTYEAATTENRDANWHGYVGLKFEVKYVEEKVRTLKAQGITPSPEYLLGQSRLKGQLSSAESALESAAPPSYDYVQSTAPPRPAVVRTEREVQRKRGRGRWD
ncbi:RHS repeat-associated core domain-containing protein [Pseudomonas coronafaciens]|uniref:RHS repeat-associated core domain-containing protein n=1 Tax=Pseudomonas coronafaciens TaxID=53409 RepID=UPI000EFF44D1|nr:RHS repeat-associated core domain-containing protein [Pseudomonas coronafaciens]RMV67469.1 YD repeat protein [Pseudomonas coronafaciens pv. atropurpurea]